MCRTAAILLTLFLCGAAGAAQDNREIQTVPVDGVRNPQMKSYRAVAAGIDMYARQHDLAPAVQELRFRIGTTSGQYINDPNLTLRIASDLVSVPVPVTADGIFTIPWNTAAFDSDASLIFNRRDGTYQIAPEIRSPGLPENVRRLGDLRLECKVAVAIVKEEIPKWVVGIANVVLQTSDWCMTRKGDTEFAYPSQYPLRSATLRFGNRRHALEIDDISFKVPLAERWPDDALIELEYLRP